MSKKRPHRIRKTVRSVYPRFTIIEAGTLAELNELLFHAELEGYVPHSPVHTHYDNFFQSHSILLKYQQVRK